MMFYGLVYVIGLLCICDAQLTSHLSPDDLQQCATDLACSVNYSSVFQTKLDNASHFMDLELALLRNQFNNVIQPINTDVKMLEANYSHQITSLTDSLTKAEATLLQDRESLSNLSRSLYMLNDDVHKESMGRNQDVHKLVLELNDAKSSITSLQNTVNVLLAAHNGTTPLAPIQVTTGAGNTQSCAAKDHVITELRANLTYSQNAYTSSQKQLQNVGTIEAFLQTQVVQLKANLTKAESSNTIKDKVIVSLQQQLKTALASSVRGPTPGTCGSDLGMKSGVIPDTAITASESQTGYGPEHARLDNGQGWYTQEKEHTKDYLQIDTGATHYVTKVATQGAPCCDVMVTNYTLQYSQDGVTWQDYVHNCQTQYFSGNSDTTTVVTHVLDEAIKARYIRFNVLDFKKDGPSNYVGMRAEMYGCTAN